ncbi:MAG: hypothetical protein AAF203_01455 [Pseudomonadota bacterium]
MTKTNRFFNLLGFLSLVIFISVQSFGQFANNGWHPELAQLRSLPEGESYIFLMLTPSQTALSYASPRALKESLFFNFRGFSKDIPTVGHTMFAWQCSGFTDSGHDHPQMVRGMSAYSGEVDQQFQKMLASEYGLSGLLAQYTDGYFWDPQGRGDNDKFGLFFGEVWNGGLPLKWMGFRVSDEGCGKAVTFLEDFAKRQEQAIAEGVIEGRLFGFNLNPKVDVGAGCSSMGQAFLQAAGLFPKISQNWSRSLPIPRGLLGAPKEPSLPPNVVFEPDVVELISQEGRVSMTKLFFHPWTSFDPKDVISLELVDIELMFFTVGEIERQMVSRSPKVAQYLPSQRLQPRTERRYSVDGVVGFVDKPIDRNLDEKTKKIHKLIDQVVEGNEATIIRKIGNVPGLIFTNQKFQ